MLGTAEKVTIDKDNTTIVNGAGLKKISLLVLIRLKLKLKALLLIMIEKNFKSACKLAGGVAVHNVVLLLKLR